MEKFTLSILSLLALVATAVSGTFDVKIYWDGSIPGAHAYAWDGIPNQGTYIDLGEVSVGCHTFTITNEINLGGEFLVCTPSTFALINDPGEAPITDGILQVWVWQDTAGINWFPFGAYQYDWWIPDPQSSDYTDGVIPDGSGGWTNGVPVCMEPLSNPKRGKGHRK